MDQGKQAFALELLKFDAIRFGSFRLKLHERFPEAPSSPIYADFRILRSYPGLMDMAVGLLAEEARTIPHDRIADVPSGSTPLAVLLSHALRTPMVSPRVKKQHGMENEIDGVYAPNDRVLLIEDVITTGTSVLDALDILEANDLVVAGILALIDRSQGGFERLESFDYQVRTVFSLRTLAAFYCEAGKITKEQLQKTIGFSKFMKRIAEKKPSR